MQARVAAPLVALALLLLLQFWGEVEGDSTHACEGEVLRLSCPKTAGMVLLIRSGMFGKKQGTPTAPFKCGDSMALRKKCEIDITYLLKFKCEGQSSCDVMVDLQSFGSEFCPEVMKYADVEYECVPEPTINAVRNCAEKCLPPPSVISLLAQKYALQNNVQSPASRATAASNRPPNAGGPSGNNARPPNAGNQRTPGPGNSRPPQGPGNNRPPGPGNLRPPNFGPPPGPGNQRAMGPGNRNQPQFGNPGWPPQNPRPPFPQQQRPPPRQPPPNLRPPSGAPTVSLPYGNERFSAALSRFSPQNPSPQNPNTGMVSASTQGEGAFSFPQASRRRGGPPRPPTPRRTYVPPPPTSSSSSFSRSSGSSRTSSRSHSSGSSGGSGGGGDRASMLAEMRAMLADLRAKKARVEAKAAAAAAAAAAREAGGATEAPPGPTI